MLTYPICKSIYKWLRYQNLQWYPNEILRSEISHLQTINCQPHLESYDIWHSPSLPSPPRSSPPPCHLPTRYLRKPWPCPCCRLHFIGWWFSTSNGTKTCETWSKNTENNSETLAILIQSSFNSKFIDVKGQQQNTTIPRTSRRFMIGQHRYPIALAKHCLNILHDNCFRC